MVQIKFLTGKQAGSSQIVQRFPCLTGRSASSDMRLEEAGVWEKHLEITLDLSRGFVLKALPNALANVNGQPIDETVLRNGDVIEIGSVKFQFWLNQTRQRSLAMREILTWAALIGLCAGQIALVYWLSK